MQLSEVTARQKLACPACGGEAQWNPSKKALICAYCGTESPYEVKDSGEIVEHGPVLDVIDSPKEPYTAKLLSAIPTFGEPMFQ